MSLCLLSFSWLACRWSESWEWDTWMNQRMFSSSQPSLLTVLSLALNCKMMLAMTGNFLKTKLRYQNSLKKVLSRILRKVVHSREASASVRLETIYLRIQSRIVRHSTVTRRKDILTKRSKPPIQWIWWQTLIWWTICWSQIFRVLSTCLCSLRSVTSFRVSSLLRYLSLLVTSSSRCCSKVLW